MDCQNIHWTDICRKLITGLRIISRAVDGPIAREWRLTPVLEQEFFELALKCESPASLMDGFVGRLGSVGNLRWMET